jgi:pimeloyl-ACP methyl ester carboxylesterase
VRVVWGDRDRIARARASRHADELPAHAAVETWVGCGHMVMWDAPQRVVRAALSLPTGERVGEVERTGNHS